MGPSPLLEFFKRGEAARDVKILAAQGGLAVRAHDQLSILVHLLDDQDQEVRLTADQTLTRIPSNTLAAFLARSDVSVDLREFFGDRGIFPADVAAPDDQQPLIDAEPEDTTFSEENEDHESLTQKLATMSVPEKLKAATKGTREMRSILVRDPNKLISSTVMSSPKLTEQEVEAISRMASVSEDVLRTISSNRNWMKNYKIAYGLARNPKTPLAVSLHLLHRINDKDLSMLSLDRNVSEQLRVAARKKVASSRP